MLLGGGRSRRFGSPKLEARLNGRRLVDVACDHFLAAGFDPVILAGRVAPGNPSVLVAGPGDQMIATLRNGLSVLPDPAMPFAFAPADMPALFPEIVRPLLEAFSRTDRSVLIPTHGGRRGHPAFARSREPFFRLGDRDGAREVWRAEAAGILHVEVGTADILFDVDTPADLAAAGDEAARRERLIARGSLAG